MGASDDKTLAFYDRSAADFVDQSVWPFDLEMLADTARLLPESGHVLDLGCGSAWAAKAFADRGFKVTATDGSPGIAEQARQRTGLPVTVLRFDELVAVDTYDLIWASCSLHHVPQSALPDLIQRITDALRPGGWFAMSVKCGEGEARDNLDRFYAYYEKSDLTRLFAANGKLTAPEFRSRPGIGFSGTPSVCVWALAQHQ